MEARALHGEGRADGARPTPRSSSAKRIHRRPSSTDRPELAPGAEDSGPARVHSKVLASTLARAVDAKDSYLRRHCEIVVGDALDDRVAPGSTARVAALRLRPAARRGPDQRAGRDPREAGQLTDAEYETRGDAPAARPRHRPGGQHRSLRRVWVRHSPRALRRGRLSRRPGNKRDHRCASRIILVADAFRSDDLRPALYARRQRQSFAVGELRAPHGDAVQPVRRRERSRVYWRAPARVGSAPAAGGDLRGLRLSTHAAPGRSPVSAAGCGAAGPGGRRAHSFSSSSRRDTSHFVVELAEGGRGVRLRGSRKTRSETFQSGFIGTRLLSPRGLAAGTLTSSRSSPKIASKLVRGPGRRRRPGSSGAPKSACARPRLD